MFDRFLKSESARQPKHRYHFREPGEVSISKSFRQRPRVSATLSNHAT